MLYVGRRVDPESLEVTSAEVRLDPDLLTTHAVCFGMTGSGKTGLCVTVLEELARSGIPALVIDPKGDMTNLALQLTGADEFEPWVDAAEAEREGLSVAEHAAKVADRWKKGLEEWNVDLGDLNVTIHTPGSTAGVPVDVLGSLEVPPGDLDPESLNELVAGTVSGLLGLVGVDADPVTDPQHIVLSAIVSHAWNAGKGLDLESLIVQLVDPPFAKVGVFPVDTFFPRKDRMQLAMALNGVVASPSFAVWRQGVDLDPETLLDRVRVFSLAHLDDGQRAFFAAMLLNRVVAWSRRQPGTSALRALVYFDECFGYLPPYPKNPPTKKPILTLMKQARAVGVGTMLVSQNPVDVDYAAVSNAGTWFIGRLQTRQDRDRILQGFAADERKQLARWIEELPKRTFLLRTPKQGPRLLHSRWARSYLRGPLTRRDLERLDQDEEPVAAPPAASSAPPPPAPGAAAPVEDDDSLGVQPPPCPEGYAYRWLDPRVVFAPRLADWFDGAAVPKRSDGEIVWAPALHAELHVVFDEGTHFRVERTEQRLFFPLDDLQSLHEPPLEPGDFLPGEPPGGRYHDLPPLVDEAKELKAIEKRVIEEIYRGETAVMYRQRKLKLTSRAGEDLEAFTARVRDTLQEEIDDDVRTLKQRVDTQVERLETKRTRLERDKAQYESEAKSKMASEVVNAGEVLMGLFFGGRKKSVSTVMSRREQTRKTQERVDRLDVELRELEREVYDLEDETRTKITEIENEHLRQLDDIESSEVRLERNDIRLDNFGIVWVPISRVI